MKRLLAVAVAICLVFGLVATAAATDVKMSGAMYVRGFNFETNDLAKDKTTNNSFYDQRFRLYTKFQIDEGSGVLIRCDILEDQWGTDTDKSTESKIIDFDYAYGWFTTGFGKFTLGHMNTGSFGTKFVDEWDDHDAIVYDTDIAGFAISARIEKDSDGENDIDSATQADDDNDRYALSGIYKWNGGEAGAELTYTHDSSRADDLSYKGKYYLLNPYVKATFGAIYVEAELGKYFGNESEYEDNLTTSDVDKSGMSYFVSAKYTMGPLYVGAFYAYVEGDDPNTASDNELGPTGNDWDLGLILFQDDDCGGKTLSATGGGSTGNTFGGSGVGSDDGAKGYGLFGGYKISKDLSLKFALVSGTADEKGTYVDDDFGTEFDLIGVYKITPAVSYTAGFAYLWTGDYYKGTNSSLELEDTYLLMHRIDWKF